MSDDKKLRCVKCNSTQIYFRRITNERVCRTCGHIEKLEETNYRGENL